MRRIVAVTGGSSGIGLAIAQLFARKGCTVYELSRSGTDRDGIIHLTADVTDEQSVQTAFEHIAQNHECIDVLVNCAGFGISGAIEFTAIEDAQRQMDVNFFGVVRAIQKALPYLRKSKRASIINISSMGGPLALPFQAFYSCSKAAINALTLALANELRQFDIAVCAVMPGDVVTGFTDARQKSETGSELYGNTIAKSVSTMEKDERSGMSPDRIARKVWSLAQKRHPKPLSTVGLQYKFFAFLYKALPARMVNWIVGLIYT